MQLGTEGGKRYPDAQPAGEGGAALENYKGIYYNNPNEKFFDKLTGAHFEYSDMCHRLGRLLMEREVVQPTNSVNLGSGSNSTDMSKLAACSKPQPNASALVVPPANHSHKSGSESNNSHHIHRQHTLDSVAQPYPILSKKIVVHLARRQPTNEEPLQASPPRETLQPRVKYFRQLRRPGTRDLSGPRSAKRPPLNRSGTNYEVSDAAGPIPPLDLSQGVPRSFETTQQEQQYRNPLTRSRHHKRVRSECATYARGGSSIPVDAVPVMQPYIAQ